MGNRNSDSLVISFDAKEGLKALENNIMDAMDGISNEMQKKLEDAFSKAGKNPRLKKQLTGVYQGLFDDLTKSAGNLDESNKAVDRFVGKIDYLSQVIIKTKKDGKINQGLLDGLSIKDMDKVLEGYDKVVEAEEKIRKYESADFKENKRSETTVKSLKELEKAYGKTGKAQEEYAEKVNTYLKSAGVETSSISKEIKEYSSLLALFEKINSTKIDKETLKNDPDAAIKKSQALLYIMQQITDLEKGNKLLGKFRIDESEIKNLKSSVAVLSQQVEGSINNFVKGITTGLKNEISNTLINAVKEAEKASQHQFISAQKTQAKIGTGSGSGTGDAKGEINGVSQAAQNAEEDVNNLGNALNNLGGGKGGSGNELDLWEASAKNLGKEFENLNKYTKGVEDTFERLNVLWKSYDKGLSMTEDEITEMWGLMKRFDELELNGLTGGLKLNQNQIDEFKEWENDKTYSKLFGRIETMTEAQLAEIEKLKAAKKEVSDQPVSGAVNKVDGTEEAVEATARLTEAEKEASEQAEKLEKELSDAGGISKEKIEQLTSAINELKEKSQVAIDVVIDNAVANTNTIKDKINELPDKKEIEIRVKDFSDMPYLTDPKTGKPLTLYRGTREAISGTVGADQNGLSYYSTDRRVAESYIAQHGGKLITANGAMKNPLEIDAEGSRWDNLTYIGEGFDEVSKKLWNLKDSISKYREDLGKLKKDSSEYKEVNDKLNNALEEQKKILADTSNPYVMNATTDEFADKVKASGLYDGLILKNIIDGGGITATDVVFFDEQQIRNAQVLNSELDKTVQKKEEIASVDKTQVDSTTTSQIETQQKLQAELEETKQQAKETTTALSDGNQTLSDSNQVVKAQDKIQEELRETREEAEKTNAVLSESNQKDILSSPTQKFDNDMQRDLVYLENYKNTIKEIDALKLQPETDETRKKLEELNKLADYFVSKISILESEAGGTISPAGIFNSYGLPNPGLQGYPTDKLKEIHKLGSEKYGLSTDSIIPEFKLIGEEISKIESKSEELRKSLGQTLIDSTKYVTDLRKSLKTIAQSQEELKTETSPKWIEAYNKDIDNALSKFPELAQFKDKFTTEDSALRFFKTSEWNDFLATLPQAKAYLESIGYEFKEIAQAQSHQNGILSGTENTPEIKKESEAVEELTNSYKELSSIKDLQAQKKGGNYSQVLVDGLSDAMAKMKAFYDAGQTESLEYYAILSRIANIQKEMWTYSGGGKTTPADQLSQSNKDYDDRLSMQDSILQDFMQFKSTTNDVVDFVIQQFSDMRHNVKGSFSGLFDDTGKILSQKVREQVSDMFKPLGNQSGVSLGDSDKKLDTFHDKAQNLVNAIKEIYSQFSGTEKPLNNIFNSMFDGIFDENASAEIIKVSNALDLLYESYTITSRIIHDGTTNLGGIISNPSIIGDTEKGITILGRPIEDLEFIKDLKPRLEAAKREGANVAQILDYIVDDTNKIVYEFQETAQGYGTGFGTQNAYTTFLEATDEQILKLISDIEILQKHGLALDLRGDNILFDKENGFSFIDLATDLGYKSGNQNVFGALTQMTDHAQYTGGVDSSVIEAFEGRVWALLEARKANTNAINAENEAELQLAQTREKVATTQPHQTEVLSGTTAPAKLHDVVEELEIIEIKEDEVITKTQTMYRAFNSEHGIKGKGISWFGDDLENVGTYIDNINTKKDSLAELTTDISKFFVVDANGSHWGEIMYDGVSRTADELAEMAKQAGYAGIAIQNVYDSYNGIGSGNLGTTFAIFDENVINNAVNNTEELKSKLNELNEIEKHITNTLSSFNGRNNSIWEQAKESFRSVVLEYKNGSITIGDALTKITKSANSILSSDDKEFDFKNKVNELWTSLKSGSKFSDDIYKGYGSTDWKSIVQDFVNGTKTEEQALQELEAEFRNLLELKEATLKPEVNQTPLSSDDKTGEKAKETAEEVKEANEKIEASNEKRVRSEEKVRKYTAASKEDIPRSAKIASSAIVNSNDEVINSNEDVIRSEEKVRKYRSASNNTAPKLKTTSKTTSTIKDTFDANKEASEMEKVATTAEEAAQSKKDFATANEGVQASVDDSKSKLQLEAELMDSIAKSAREAAEAKKEFAKANELVQQSVNNTQNATKNDKYKDKTKVSNEEYTSKSNQYASIANQKLLSNGYTILGESVNTELVDGLVKVSAKIKTAEGAWKTFSAKIDADGNMFEQRFRTITKNVDKLEQELASFGQTNVSSSSGVDKIIEAYETLAKTELDFQKLKAKSSTKRGLTIDEADKLSKLEQIRAKANQTLKQQTDLTEEQTQASKRYANELERVQSLMSRNVVSKEKQALEKMWTDYNRISTNKKDFSYDANYERELDALKSQLKELDGLAENLQFVDDKDIEKFAELRQSAEQALNAIKEKTGNLKFKTPDVADVRKKMNEIQKIMEQNTRMPKDMKDTFEALKRKYQLLIDTKGSVSQFKSLNGELEELVLKLRESGKTGKSFFSTVGAQLKSMNSRLLAYYFSMYDFIRYARYAINAVVELDNALLDLKKTTTMTDQQLENFYYTSNDIAKKMGVTTAQIVEQASAWSRLGYSSEEAATTMAQLSSQFASISPGMETDQAQEGLVSIMKAWDIDTSEVKSEIMDKINILGNSFAESNSDLVEGMKRSAAALAAVGTEYTDAFALFTGAQEVLQNAEVTGRALRSISMRIRGYSESSEDGFEEVDDELKTITGDLIDLTKTAEHSQGVSIFKEGSTTEFKSLVDYFGEISEIWDEMTQVQQNDFLQMAFGKTQANLCLYVQKCT